jgi:clan AA aspartic protease (TIGR02281 family)
MKGKRVGQAVLLAAVAGLSGCAQPAGPCAVSLAAIVPMHDSADRFVVSGQINGADMKLILDTGSAATLVSVAAMTESERLNGYGSIHLTGVGGELATGVQQVHQLTLGRLYGRIDAVGMRFNGKPAVDGLLGEDIVGNYDVDLDAAGGTLRLYKTQGACQSAMTNLAPPLYAVDYVSPGGPGRSPSVPVTINGLRFTALIDTGAQGTAVSDAAARRLGLDLSHDRSTRVGGFGPAVTKAHIHVLDRVTIGDLSLNHVQAEVLSPDAFVPTDIVLGIDFARRMHLWLSNSSGKLVMQFPPQPSPPAGGSE